MRPRIAPGPPSSHPPLHNLPPSSPATYPLAQGNGIKGPPYAAPVSKNHLTQRRYQRTTLCSAGCHHSCRLRSRAPYATLRCRAPT
eukprot:354060-Chlamydomonas_euryale.AAC.12